MAMTQNRRAFVKGVGAAALAGMLPACAAPPPLAARGHVVVVGGGFGGATAARYLRLRMRLSSFRHSP
jgi:sulfite dehydrogenase